MTSTTVIQKIKALTQTELKKRGGDNTTTKNDINPLLENCVVFLLKTEGMIICGRGEWNPPILVRKYDVKRGFFSSKMLILAILVSFYG